MKNPSPQIRILGNIALIGTKMPSITQPCTEICTSFSIDLTVNGMRGDTFITLSFLDQILSAEFLTKISKLFCRWKLTWIGLIWCLAKLIESYKKCLQKKAATNEHFPCFYSSCQIGPGLIPSFILTAYSFACCSASGPLNCT